MSKRAAPGFSERLKTFRTEHGMPWLARTYGEKSLRAWGRRIGIEAAAWLNWEKRGSVPNRFVLREVATRVGMLNADAWVDWLLLAGAQPAAELISTEGMGGASVRSANVVPVLVEGVERAIAAFRRGEDGTPLLEGVIRIAREARHLGLATILSFAMIGAVVDAAAGADDLTSRSGGIGRRARFRAMLLLRALLAQLGALIAEPTRRSPSLSAVGAYGEIITLDDVRARLEMPKHRTGGGEAGEAA